MDPTLRKGRAHHQLQPPPSLEKWIEAHPTIPKGGDACGDIALRNMPQSGGQERCPAGIVEAQRTERRTVGRRKQGSWVLPVNFPDREAKGIPVVDGDKQLLATLQIERKIVEALRCRRQAVSDCLRNWPE